MSTTLSETNEWTAADLVEQFGPILLRRIRTHPAPGTAVEQDVIDIHDREGRLCELVDGTLVEKTMGIQESYLAILIGKVIGIFLDEHELGIVLGTDGMARLAPGLVRIPDVSFVSWDLLGGKQVPPDSMLDGGPDLAVEVLSPGNTDKEMARKLDDYFEANVRAVRFVDPRTRTVQIFDNPQDSVTLNEDATLDGGDVLPGFSIPLRELFARLKHIG